MKGKTREKKQLDPVFKKFDDITNLLILIAAKSGAKSEEIGKVLGVDASRARQILAGFGTKKKRKRVRHGKRKGS
jgi:hypothetical protein